MPSPPLSLTCFPYCLKDGVRGIYDDYDDVPFIPAFCEPRLLGKTPRIDLYWYSTLIRFYFILYKDEWWEHLRRLSWSRRTIPSAFYEPDPAAEDVASQFPVFGFRSSDCVRFGTALDVWHFILAGARFRNVFILSPYSDAVSEKRSVTRADQGAWAQLAKQCSPLCKDKWKNRGRPKPFQFRQNLARHERPSHTK
jgi:hypothetical protein